MSNKSDLELLSELGVEPIKAAKTAKTPREARIISGFEEIQRFVEEHGRPPQHGEGRDIFERLFAARLDAIREQEECVDLVKEIDHQGLLDEPSTGLSVKDVANLDDEALLAELGAPSAESNDLTELKHVRSQTERRAAEEIGERKACSDFENFEPLFEEIRADLKTGRRQTRRYARMAGIQQGEFFVVNGQIAYVADVGEEFETEYERRDSRLRIIYDNGTESDILLRSLQRALHRDENGRRVTDPEAGPLFEFQEDAEGTETGTIYVLKSLSSHPTIDRSRDVIHKIGVTGGDVEKRIGQAEKDATFLLARVEVMATYKLVNINRTGLENLLHRFFSAARLDIEIKDELRGPIRPREWFVVPLPVIDQAVQHIRDKTLHLVEYDLATATIVDRP